MKRYRYRSAITGRYVTREYAEQHPETTVREQVREHKGFRRFVPAFIRERL